MKRAPRAIRRRRKFRARPAAHDGLTVIAAYGNRCIGFTPEMYARHRVGKSVVVCRDGYRMSVIAGPGTRCSPAPSMVDRGPFVYDRYGEVPPAYRGPYHEVEVQLYGTPPWWWDELFPLAGDGPVRLPVSVVRYLIDQHGGFARMERHPGLRRQKADFVAVMEFYATHGVLATWPR